MNHGLFMLRTNTETHFTSCRSPHIFDLRRLRTTPNSVSSRNPVFINITLKHLTRSPNQAQHRNIGHHRHYNHFAPLKTLGQYQQLYEQFSLFTSIAGQFWMEIQIQHQILHLNQSYRWPGDISFWLIIRDILDGLA
jgi:hypothetical protein